MTDDLLTTSKVAQMAGVSTRTVRNWTDQGKLHADKTAGGHRRYSRAEVEKFLEKLSIPKDGISY